MSEHTVIVRRETKAVIVRENNPAPIVVRKVVNRAVVSRAVQGPPGPPGGNLTAVASVNLSGHRIVRLNENNQFEYAQPTLPNVFSAVGMTTGAIGQSAEGTAQLSGAITESSWNWTPQQPIFLSQNGNLTQTAPTSNVLLEVARALTPTRIILDFKQPIILS